MNTSSDNDFIKIEPILVHWQCGMGDQCINKDEPGSHRGDHGYENAQKCVRQGEPRDLKRLGLK